MNATKRKAVARRRRKLHVRSRVRGQAGRPRLSVFRSLKHISAQVIDDAQGKTLCAVSSTARGLSAELEGKTKTERAAIIGKELAKRAKDAGIETVVFDRGSSKYHGRVKALAEAAREGGLKF